MGNENGTRLVELSVATIATEEATGLIRTVDRVLHSGPGRNGAPSLLETLRAEGHSTAFTSLALHVNRVAREMARASCAARRAPLVRSLLNLRERLLVRALSSPPAAAGGEAAGAGGYPALSVEEGICKVYKISVGRLPVEEEIRIWKTNFANGLPFHEFMLLMCASPEARKQAAGVAVLGDRSEGEAVQLAFELVLGRGAAGFELEHWLNRLESGATTRSEMLATLFDTSVNFHKDLAGAPAHDGLTCNIMGTNRFLSAEEWQRQAREIANSPKPEPDERYRNRFPIRRSPGVLVSALCSLYRGGDFIEQFMDNITSQTCFRDYAELVIVDADSPEHEYETIKRYLARHKNINYLRMNYRIGIYDAWNVAAKASRGEYLTNTNLDDLRRRDSLELQAGALENLPFVDVVYQDLFYSFDPRLSFEGVAAFGHETSLPVITAHNMVKFNSPHNAPMWRKRLHDELGWFDTRYRSAGDYEFWMRCLAAGKSFYKINDPHVVYYQNPKGLSTRPDTRGVVEAMDIHKAYCRKLMPPEAVLPTPAFAGLLGAHAEAEAAAGVRNRYVLAQHALRDHARTGKFDVSRGGAA